jgi:hypothetical protein
MGVLQLRHGFDGYGGGKGSSSRQWIGMGSSVQWLNGGGAAWQWWLGFGVSRGRRGGVYIGERCGVIRRDSMDDLSRV